VERRSIACALAFIPLLAGCGVTGTGVRVEGRTTPAAAPQIPAGGGQSPSIDAVQVLRDDPGVSARIKNVIRRPCAGQGYSQGWYPIYVRYVQMPGPGFVAVVDVQDCAGDVACDELLGSYVYRVDRGRAERIFSSEETGARVAVSGSELVLQRRQWRGGESCPTVVMPFPLRWDGHTLEPAGR
jgi:hypothetical protein